jgi:hypothetical protein
MTPFSRRQFLRSATALIALPALESLGFRRFASAANPVGAAPKRFVFLGFGFGVTHETWFPDVNVTGENYALPQGLAPLTRHQKDFTVVQGCRHRFSDNPHGGSTFWLTGANPFSEPGQSFHNTISADQIAAAQLGQETRFTSIQLCSSEAAGTGHGPGLSLAWDAQGKPMPGFETPLKAFHKMFSPESTSLEQRRAMLLQERSLLDTVLEDVKDIERGLNKGDTNKLSEYLQSLRDIEIRLGKEEKWLAVEKPKSPLQAPDEALAGREEVKVMYDLLVAALQTDLTRVVTYRQPIGSLLASIGVKVAAHDMSHYSPGERMEASQRRDTAQSELLAGLIDKLKAVRGVDGSRLFDHTTLVFGSNLRSGHYLDNCPTVVAGGGSGIKLGRHVVLPKDTPLCNVWLTLLKGSAIDLERIGDSTGVVKEII